MKRAAKEAIKAAVANGTNVRQPVQSIADARMKIEWWPTSRPTPYDKNPRKISEQAIDKVATSIRQYGWAQPIVVDSAGVIVAGHTRLQAAQKLELSEVPVYVADNLTPAQVKAYRLMDNRSHDEAEWNFDLIGPELTDLKSLDFDLDYTGFDPAELDLYINGPAFGPASVEDQGRLDQKQAFISLTPEQKVIVDEAIAKVRREYQEEPPISDGRAIELICGDYLAGP